MKSAMIFLLLAAAHVFAQPGPGPDSLWNRTYGWSGADTAFSVQRTLNGGLVIAGIASLPDDPHQRTCMFLIRTDSVGVMQIWRAYGNDPTLDYGAYAVVQKRDSGYIAAGYISADSGIYEEIGQSHCFGLSALGDSLWQYTPFTVLPPDPGHISAAAEAADGGLVLAFWEEHFFGPDPRICLNKISANGTLQWIWWVSSPIPIVSHGLRILTDGSFAVVGTRTQDFNRVFLGHVSSQGQTIDTSFLGGDSSLSDEAWDVVETPDGFLLAGYTRHFPSGGLFLCKTDAACEELWIQRYMDERMHRMALAMIPALGGGYVVAGTAFNQLGDADMYLAKIDDQGEILWEQTYGGQGFSDEVAFDVIQTPDSCFVLAGYVQEFPFPPNWYIVKTAPDPMPLHVGSPGSHPSSFRLSAFPNPFNPATTISFDLPETQRVQLTIYDLQGRTIAMLLNEPVTAGTHTVSFDGSHMPSGLYFARVQAGRFIATQKLLLLK